MRRVIQAAHAESMSLINSNDIMAMVNEGTKVLEFDVEVITCPGPTRNGMLYPKVEMEKAINDPRIVDLLNRGALYGEGEHPIDPKDIPRWVNIPVENRQFKWKKLWFDGDKLMGTVQTYDGNGNLLLKSIKNGELPAFSIRVLGTPREAGQYTELHNIVLITIDWVNYPGNPTSFVNSSDKFKAVDIPLINSTHYADGRIIPRGESYDFLGLESNESLVSLGEGYYVVLENFDNEKKAKLSKIRTNAF